MSDNHFFSNSLPERVLQRRPRPREEDIRGSYFRDTTAILHCLPFRRLKKKTQVFFLPKNDHICTRVEHVLHVASISATICRALGLEADLAWAIGLGHDLGHAPFGHTGEKILSDLFEPQLGVFEHELFSLRVVDTLAGHGQGLNLTYAVRDGIVSHCGEVFEKSLAPDFIFKDLGKLKKQPLRPSTWEGVVARFSDIIAYLGRDLEDACQLKIVKPNQIPKQIKKVLGKNNGEIINTLVRNLIFHARKEGEIGFSDDIFAVLCQLKEFNYQNIYRHPLLTNDHQTLSRLLKALSDYFGELFEKNQFALSKYQELNHPVAYNFGKYLADTQNLYATAKLPHQAILDYLAGMTDDYAISCGQKLMAPQDAAFERCL